MEKKSSAARSSLELLTNGDHLVGRVVNQGGAPLALVGGVGNGGSLPFSATRALSAGRVGDGGGLPLAILLIVPVIRLLSLCNRIANSVSGAPDIIFKPAALRR